MIGGKLASFREMAEEATDFVEKKLGVSAQCRTHLLPLPGGESTPDVRGIADRCGIDTYVARRLSYRQGDQAENILGEACTKPHDKTVICPCEPVTAAEIRYVAKNEWAESLEDLFRRTRVGSGPCQGCLCAVPALSCLSEEKRWSAARSISDLESFLDTQWRARKDVLKGDQLAQEEINQAVFRGTLGIQNLSGLKDE
jgi:glycerol-3-phosphate dehydrogenase